MRAHPVRLTLAFLLILASVWLALRFGGGGEAGLDAPDLATGPAEDAGATELDGADPRRGDALVQGAEAPPADAPAERAEAVEYAAPAEGDLVVRVLDVLGRPVVDMPVVVLLDPGFTMVSQDRYRSERTDAQGLARFPRADLETLARVDGRSDAWVRLWMRLPEPLELPVDLLDPPDEPLILDPPLGRLTVDVVGPEGERIAGDVNPYVRWIADRVDDPKFTSRRGPLPLEIWVPLDRPLRVEVARIGVLRDHGENFAALTRAEPDREVTLRLLARDPAYVGRLLDPEGEPVPEGTQFTFRSTLPGPRGESYWKTQKGGHFRTRLSRIKMPIGETVEYHLTSRLGIHTADHEAHFHALVPEGDVDVDIGDVRLSERPILVSGHVVGPEGFELPYTHLRLLSREHGGEWERSGEFGIQPPHEFAAFGPWEPGREWVLTGTDWPDENATLLLERDHPFEPGTRDLEVRLVRGAWIEGSVTGTRAKLGSTRVSFRPDEVRSELPQRRQVHHVDEDLRFRAGPFHAGTGELRVLDVGPPLRVLPGVPLVAGEATDVGVIDVDVDMIEIELHVSGPKENWPVQVRYRYEDPVGYEGRDTGRVGTPLVLDLWAPRGTVDLVVSSYQHRPVLVERASGRVDVHLEPMLEVDVELRGLEPLTRPDLLPAEAERDPESPGRRTDRLLVLELEWEPDATTPELLVESRTSELRRVLPFDPDTGRHGTGEAVPFLLPAAGRYRVRGELRTIPPSPPPGATPSGSRKPRVLELLPEREWVIEVPATPDGPVVVTLPAPDDGDGD